MNTFEDALLEIISWALSLDGDPSIGSEAVDNMRTLLHNPTEEQLKEIEHFIIETEKLI